ncbi:unnamed protein product [Medioppia subpectinata]|uniref:F-box domain-containing protein n=1 Tax=Medioppia subpectinata TaxID=1979941 RepID=A0A7R9Q987_9ACAR|nr:unnamed protein product [Medioppia subpectinata]CAG2116930.1 unnamed protein product [Medioppia subpectinata]
MAQHMKHKKILTITIDDSEDEGEDNVRQQVQIYAKDSMDRLGDDLYGLVLSYLSLEDRFLYECVSKQFQRTVFECVVDITLNEHIIRKTQGVSALTYCDDFTQLRTPAMDPSNITFSNARTHCLSLCVQLA